MASEVFSIDIDLSKLQEAFRMSEDIKNNLAGIGKNGKSSMFDNIKKSNKELKVQNTLLKTSLKTLQLIRMTTKGLFAGMLGIGALAFSGFSNATKNNRKYKTVGINERQGYSLNFASEMGGFDQNALIDAAGKLQEALRDVNKLGSIKILGFDADELKKRNPVDALFEVIKETGKHDYFGTLSETVLKEAFDNTIGGFEEFRTIMGDNVKEMQAYFNEGMRIYKDNYGNLKEGDQSLIRLKNQFNRIRLMLANKFEPIVTAVLKKIEPLIEKGGDAIGKAVDKAVNWFFEINKETGKTNLDQLFINLKNLANNIATVWTKLQPVLVPLAEAFVKAADYIINNPLFESKEQGDNFQSYKQRANEIWKIGKVDERNKALIPLFEEAKESYKKGGLQKRAYNDLVKTWGKTLPDYKEYLVDDAVITKNGQVIKTSPQDYIFATKQPQALATGGNYTMNINANVRNDNDIQKMKYELDRLIKSLNARR